METRPGGKAGEGSRDWGSFLRMTRTSQRRKGVEDTKTKGRCEGVDDSVLKAAKRRCDAQSLSIYIYTYI